MSYTVNYSLNMFGLRVVSKKVVGNIIYQIDYVIEKKPCQRKITDQSMTEPFQ